MSLFSHFVELHNLPAEPAATKAMEYILENTSARRKFVEMLNPIGIEFDPGYVFGEKQLDESRPDLVIRDSDSPRIIIENKFWASLTKYQPTEYIKKLPDAKHSVVLFVVPEERKRSIWNELKVRCDDNSMELVGEVLDSPIFWGKLGEYKKIAVTSWTYTLQALESVGEDTFREVSQLKDLVNRLTTTAFIPLQKHELENFSFARRIINFRKLVDSINDDLELSDYEQVRRTYDRYNEYGVYLCLKGLNFWIGVSFLAWSEKGETPLWFNLDPSSCSAKMWQQIENMFDGVKNIGGQKYLPIELETGVEFDVVVSSAAKTVNSIASKLLELFESQSNFA